MKCDDAFLVMVILVLVVVGFLSLLTIFGLWRS